MLFVLFRNTEHFWLFVYDLLDYSLFGIANADTECCCKKRRASSAFYMSCPKQIKDGQYVQSLELNKYDESKRHLCHRVLPTFRQIHLY